MVSLYIEYVYCFFLMFVPLRFHQIFTFELCCIGLEYLHNGCRPPMVHRNIKTTNILLNEDSEAKLADFGLSRLFPTKGETHVSTDVVGTPGYLDPE